MGRIRSAWGLFALAATFIAFLVLWLTTADFPWRKEPAPSIASESLIASEVAAKYAVPAGTPVVTRVSDAAALVQINPFYKDVRDGDWLLRYDGLLIAYRHEEGRILSIQHATSTR